MEQNNMKVNFKSFRLYLNISKREYKDIDLRESIADILYQNSSGIAGLDLAQKIYKSEGEIDLSEKEVQLLKSLYPVCKPVFINSLNEVLNRNNG